VSPRFDEGSAVTVLVRPEQIKVKPTDEGNGRGVVLHCEYFGHDAILTVGLAPDAPWQVRVPGPEALAPGTRIEIRFEGEALAWR